MATDEREITEGKVLAFERVFTVEDVRAFATLSEDRAAHHVAPDAAGRLLVHGLLLATLPTQIGGSFGYLAREMRFEFLRPVFTGDRIRCEATVARVEPGADRIHVDFGIVCRNEHGKEVMRGSATGIIRR
jgi:3-hydroxybutyryl-CoA dehydratase